MIKLGDHILQQRCNITHAQLKVLLLVECMGPVSQSHLAQELDLTQAAISRLCETMVKKKILNRVADPTNRRANQLTLTESGKTLIKQALQLIKDLENSLYASFPERTIKTWDQTTQRILKSLHTQAG